jgi:anaerobic magnesium-protoporphyrin IX monomethyl ester cyclase
MKIALVNPPALPVYGRYRTAAKAAAQPQVQLGLLYVAGALLEAGHDVAVLDADADSLSVPRLVSAIREKAPDVVGIGASTPLIGTASRIFESLESMSPRPISVLGGFHPTALPEESAAQTATDYVVRGEGETTLVKLLEALEGGTDPAGVEGVTFVSGGETISTPEPISAPDLDSLPVPARNLVDKRNYLWSVPGKGLVPVTSIVTQRGCPFRCVFCGVRTMFPHVRHRAPDKVADEIESIVKDLGIKHIMFQDDTLGLSRSKMRALFDELDRRGVRFTWEGYTRPDVVDYLFLREMRSAGLTRLSFGVESGDPEILKAVKKDVRTEQYRAAYDWCKRLGIETRCSLMLGLPFETEATVRQTVSFACSLKCYQAYINIATPYPGSELLELARNGYGGLRLLTEDWEEYRRYGNAVMEMNDLTPERLVELQEWAYRKFYLRPRVILYNLARAGPRAALLNSWAYVRSVLLPATDG